jgi:type II secretory pathway component PulF
MPAYGPRFRSLASMHRAGIPWPRAVESAGTGDPAWEAAARALDSGRTFPEAFAGIVDPLDAALLQAGEQDGSLGRVLVEIADAEDEERRRRREALTGMLYPLVLAHVAAVLMPIPDLLAGDVGGGLGWMAAILVPTWGFLGLRAWWRKRDREGPKAGEVPAPAPMVWPFLDRVEEADARALSALGRLYEAGLPLPEALELAQRAGWGGRVAFDLVDAKRRVGRGSDLSGAWQHLPAEMVSRLRSAEEAGSLGDALGRAAEELRFGVRTRRQRVGAVLPVVLLLVVGGIIAVRVLSFYASYYSNLPF